jgi:hypothetical protein
MTALQLRDFPAAHQLAAHLHQRQLHQDSITVPLALVDLCKGDYVAALMLGTILDAYRDGPLVPVHGDPVPWVPASWEYWYRRLRLNRRRGKRALSDLVVLGYVRSKRLGMPGVKGNGGGTRSQLCVQLHHDRFLTQWSLLASGHAPLYLEDDPD